MAKSGPDTKCVVCSSLLASTTHPQVRGKEDAILKEGMCLEGQTGWSREEIRPGERIDG